MGEKFIEQGKSGYIFSEDLDYWREKKRYSSLSIRLSHKPPYPEKLFLFNSKLEKVIDTFVYDDIIFTNREENDFSKIKYKSVSTLAVFHIIKI